MFGLAQGRLCQAEEEEEEKPGWQEEEVCVCAAGDAATFLRCCRYAEGNQVVVTCVSILGLFSFLMVFVEALNLEPVIQTKTRTGLQSDLFVS